jgi:hypothetical protein
MERLVFNEAHEGCSCDLFGHGTHIEDGRGAHWDMGFEVLRTQRFEVDIAATARNERDHSGNLTVIDELAKLGREFNRAWV